MDQYFWATIDEQPKIFKEEGVNEDLELNQSSSISTVASPVSAPVSIKAKIDSVMPTPLAYSRSSSMTSLNSFDAKSVHSSVASEYSHRLSNIGASMRRLKKNKKDLDRINSDADEDQAWVIILKELIK
jgi:hypothetical protein